jgi:hypothetical protein
MRSSQFAMRNSQFAMRNDQCAMRNKPDHCIAHCVFEIAH